jgi:hypothetical protein
MLRAAGSAGLAAGSARRAVRASDGAAAAAAAAAASSSSSALRWVAAPLLLRHRPAQPTGPAARAAGDGSKGWLGGLPSWPNRDDAPAEEEGEEEDDDDGGASMRPINDVLGDGSGGSGGASDAEPDPLAALVAGLGAEDLERLRAAMHAIDADIVRLIPCPRAALEPGAALTLEEAVALPRCPLHEPAPEGLLPGAVVFLSGMTGPEVAEIVRCYRDVDGPRLPPAAFCALVPGNRARTVRELAMSVWQDERRVRERRARAAEEEEGGGGRRERGEL